PLASGARLPPLHELPPGVIVTAHPSFAEEIWMAPPHLLFQRVCDDLGIELRALLADHDLKREMQQQITQLVPHGLRVVGLDGVIELESFFDQIWTERLGGLRAVPRAALPQFAYESQSTSKRGIALHLASGPGIIPTPVSVPTRGEARGEVDVGALVDNARTVAQIADTH